MKTLEMKTIIFAVIILANQAFSNTLFAQAKSETPCYDTAIEDSRLHSARFLVFGGYAVECDYQLKYIFNPDGSIRSTSWEALYDSAECNSSKRQFEYDDFGNIHKAFSTRFEEKWSNGKYLGLLRFYNIEVHTYDSAQRLISKTRDFYVNDSLQSARVDLFCYEVDYDKHGNLLEETKFSISGDEKLPISKRRNHWDSLGNCVQQQKYIWQQGRWHLDFLTEKSYNQGGDLLEEVTTSVNYSDLKKTIRKYNKQGQMTSIVSEKWQDHRFEKYYKDITYNSYDSVNRIKRVCNEKWTYYGLHTKYEDHYLYDFNNNVAQVLRFAYNTSTGIYLPESKVIYFRGTDNYVRADSYRYNVKESTWYPAQNEINDILTVGHDFSKKTMETRFRAEKVIFSTRTVREYLGREKPELFSFEKTGK